MFKNGSIRMSIAQRLQAARKQAGLSQGQVAHLLNLQRPAISEIEAGRRRVSAEELSKLAEIYAVSMSWITKNQPDVPDPAVELAARELAKLKKEDFETILNLLRSLRKAERT